MSEQAEMVEHCKEETLPWRPIESVAWTFD
jgi:hypothetical protein